MTQLNPRFLIVTLVLALLASVFAGCTGTATTPTTAPTAAAATATKAAEATQKPEETPAPAEPVTLTCWATLDSLNVQVITTWNDCLAIQQATEATGVTIDWQLPPQGQAAEQFNLMVVSDTLPDMIWYNIRSSYPGGASAALADDLIIPLNDYEDAMPNYMAFLEANPEAMKMAKTDEGIHYAIQGFLTRSMDAGTYSSITNRKLEYECYTGMIINEKWLKELDIEVPVTIDDWTRMLTAFQTEKNSAAPLTVTNGQLVGSNAFISMYDVCHYLYPDADQQVHYGPVEDGYLDFLTLMNDWYNKKLMDNDFAALDDNAMMAKIISGESGAYIGYGSRIGIVYRDTRQSDPDTYPIAVASPVLEEGQTLLYAQRGYPLAGNSVSVSTDCENVQRALQFWDFFWSEEGAMAANWGVEDVSYTINAQGMPEFTDMLNNNPDGFDSNTVTARFFLKNGPIAMAMENRWAIQKAYITPQAVEGPIYWSSINGALPNGMPPVSLTQEETTAYASAYNDIKTYTDEMRTKFIMGVEPLSNYEQFVEALWGMGLQEVLDIQQDALDRYNSR